MDTVQVFATCRARAALTSPRIVSVHMCAEDEGFVGLDLGLRIHEQDLPMRVSHVPVRELLGAAVEARFLVPAPRGQEEDWQFAKMRVLYDPCDGRVMVSPNGSKFTVVRAGMSLRLDGPMQLAVYPQRHDAGYSQIELSISKDGGVIALRIMTANLLLALVQIGALELTGERADMLFVRLPADRFNPITRRLVRG